MPGNGNLNFSFELQSTDAGLTVRCDDDVLVKSLRLSESETVFDFVDDLTKSIHLSDKALDVERSLSFEFVGGLIGWFGYESSLEPQISRKCNSTPVPSHQPPTAAFQFVDQLLGSVSSHCFP